MKVMTKYRSNTTQIDEVRASNKIFVGGLGRNTTTEGLRQYFSKCGTVIDAQVMVDIKTGLSRCFGFVTFEEGGAIDTALEGKHKIDGVPVGLRIFFLL